MASAQFTSTQFAELLNGRRARRFGYRMVANRSRILGFYRLAMVFRHRAALHSRYRWLARWRKEVVMADPGSVGHVFRRAFSWLPAQFASQSDAPVGAAAVPFHRAPVNRGHRGFRRRRAADERALAGRASPFAVCPMRGRSGRPKSCPRRSARFPPDPHPQHVARITVRDPALST